MERAPEIFGSRNRTAVLEVVRLLGDTYPSELAEVLGVRLFTVQRILASLERESVLVSRPFGRTRRVTFNPRYLANRELDALLWKLAKADTSLQVALAARRRRPRRAGKPGL